MQKPLLFSTLSQLEFERAVLGRVVAGMPLREVLEHVVHRVENRSEQPLRASVLLVDATGKRLVHGAAPSLPDEYNRIVDGLEFGPLMGSCGAAAFRGEPVIVEDIQTDPVWAAFRDIARQYDLRACWSMPIHAADGRLLGTFANYYSVPKTPSPEELDDIAQVASVTALAIERHASDRALRESEERLRIAQQAGGIGTFEIFPHDGRLAVSEELCWQWGLTPRHEYRLDDLLELVHPDDRERVRAGHLDMPAGALDYLEYRIRRPDNGEERWMARRGEAIEDSAGGLRYLGVTYDITGHKRFEERLRVSETQLRRLNDSLAAEVDARTRERNSIWRNSRDLFIVASSAGVLRAVNPAWTDILGFREDELIGKSFAEIVHPDDVEATEAALLSAARSGLVRFENRNRHKDGSYRWVSWVAAPEGDALYGNGRDVTSEKETQRALQQTEEALRQAQKMEALGQLTGGIAHDFNNLLQGITGPLELIRRYTQLGRTNDIDRFISMATGAANRAASLTHRLLAFSRRQPLDPKPVNADELLHSIDDLLKRTMGEAIDTRVVPNPHLWLTRCDVNQLENALLNFAINARDAMPEGGRLTLETGNAELGHDFAARHPDVAPGSYVVVSVSDTGAGMPADVKARAFDPFYTTKPLGQGTGLGLSMAYGFAKQSGGIATIDSAPDAGTTIRLYLPRFSGDPGTQEIAGELNEAHRAAGRHAILVVEDDESVRELVCEILRDLDYQVLEAFDGPSGLTILNSPARIDLLVTDVGLPGLNGRQLADAARATRPRLRVLFMTGYAEAATRTDGFLDTGMEMITKPFTLESMASRIRRMVTLGLTDD
ncbi:PAS domain-containing protein [Caballeronia sp. LjRoot34]|uniref:PAS domain-containing protein n=1 Tax=Caballeronia sp. LjRoot34 TaxID=3342325 RepID=UPI003ED091CD